MKIDEKAKSSDMLQAGNVPPLNDKPKKKNRQLQFYKFLFYSNKLEIIIQDFLSLARFSNCIEIVAWVVSLILCCNTPDNKPEIPNGEEIIQYNATFIVCHLFHVIRGVIGLILWMKLPRSYQVIDQLNSISEPDLEKKFFNDIIRDYMNKNVITPIQNKKFIFLSHIIFTFINLAIDLVDFFVLLSGVYKSNNESKVVIMTYFFIDIIYLSVDLSYFTWSMQLKYKLPKAYLVPIQEALDGFVNRIKSRMKIGKKETDVKKENEIQNKLPEIKDKIVDNSINRGSNVNVDLNNDSCNNNNNEVGVNEVKIDL